MLLEVNRRRIMIQSASVPTTEVKDASIAAVYPSWFILSTSQTEVSSKVQTLFILLCDTEWCKAVFPWKQIYFVDMKLIIKHQGKLQPNILYYQYWKFRSWCRQVVGGLVCGWVCEGQQLFPITSVQRNIFNVKFIKIQSQSFFLCIFYFIILCFTIYIVSRCCSF